MPKKIGATEYSSIVGCKNLTDHKEFVSSTILFLSPMHI